MAGRNPKPTALKRLQGNRGKRPLPANEPKLTLGVPDMPPDLDVIAREEWERVTPELLRTGVLAKIQRAGLEAYCRWYSIWRRRMTELESARGRARRTAFLEAAEASKRLLAFAAQYGLTPAMQTKVAARPADAPDEWDGFDAPPAQAPTTTTKPSSN